MSLHTRYEDHHMSAPNDSAHRLDRHGRAALLERLLAAGQEVRCLVRDPRRLGPNRVRVQITLGDLANPFSVRQAVRGVETVAHLAATIRDQPGGQHRGAERASPRSGCCARPERAGARRFLFFGAMGATRDVAAASSARRRSPSRPCCAPGSTRPCSRLDRLRAGRPMADAAAAGCRCCRGCRSPATGEAAYQPIWAEDVAACAACLDATASEGARRASLRARRAGDAHLRGDRAARARRVGPPAPAHPRAAAGREAEPAGSSSAWPAPRPSPPGRRPS